MELSCLKAKKNEKEHDEKYENDPEHQKGSIEYYSFSDSDEKITISLEKCRKLSL